MIPWRKIQKTNFTHLESLCDFLELSSTQRATLLKKPSFPLNLPVRLAQKIRKGTLEDPILRQFVPLEQETLSPASFQDDAVGDLSARRSRKLLHKYQGRALLLASSACAMHCRFCFRQKFPYETKDREFSQELSLIEKDPSLHEIILSGGDPLSLATESLTSLLSSLDQIPHIQRIRFHTRFPIGIPERIDEPLLNLLSSSSKQIIMVLHSNHARELDSDVLFFLKKIQQLGIPLLNQAVLLKGVNDDEQSLLSLCETLINAGIIPYYLHLLDRVNGTAHFETSLERGKELISYLQKNLPGYGVPRLVREEQGLESKTFL